MKYTLKERKKLYDDATTYWGKPAQYDQFIEESCELIVAINKFKRKSFYGEYKNDESIEENLIEELVVKTNELGSSTNDLRRSKKM